MRAGSCAADACEPRQVRKEAAVDRTFRVTQECLTRALLLNKPRDRLKRGCTTILPFHGRLAVPSLHPANLRAKKRFGQHFLVNRAVLKRILAAASLTAEDVVIEVGPGRGAVTSMVGSRVSQMVAVELDRDLFQYLQEKLASLSNIRLVNADARDIEPEELVGDAPYKVIANLPYYAASLIMMRFLEARHKPALMVIMVQKEVAQSMVALPGNMSLLSIAVQLYGNPKIVSYVPPGAFRPKPKVSSAIVKIEVSSLPRLHLDSVGDFFGLVRAGFSAKRKQLKNALSNGLDLPGHETEGLVEEAGIDAKRRAQTLTLEEWGSLYGAWRLNYRHVGSQGACQD